MTFAPSFAASAPSRSRATGNFRPKSLAWACTSASDRSGSTQTPTSFSDASGNSPTSALSVGL